MFRVRLREYTPQGVRGKVIPFQSARFTVQNAATAALEFTVSEKVAGRMVAPFVVGVEYSIGPGGWSVPRNNLFVVTGERSDGSDLTDTVTYTGEGYVSWLLKMTYLHWSSSAKNGERHWRQDGTNSANPGYILNGMLIESKNRGWAPMLSWDFNGTTASNGSAWSLAGGSRWWQPWKLLTPLSQVLEQLTRSGYCEWWAEGTTLRLFKYGVGSVLPNVKLGGPGITSVPQEASFDGVYTHLTVVPEKARYWLYLENTGAESKFGRLEATMTQSGVESHTEATQLAQADMAENKTLKRETTFEWSPVQYTPQPFYDFNVGDTVQARIRDVWTDVRVLGISISVTDEGPFVSVTVGKRTAGTALRKLAARSASSVVGTIIGGTGNSMPAAAAPLQAPPAAPVGLNVASNVGYFTNDDSAHARVGFAWNAVTIDDLGAEIDVDQYELWHRRPGQASSRLTATDELSAVVDSFDSGVDRLVKVRARSVAGVWGTFSAEIEVSPAFPVLILPAPTTPVPSSELAVVTVPWDGLLGGEEPPAGFKHVIVERLDGSVWQPVGQPLNGAGIAVITGLEIGSVAQFRLVGYSVLGVRGTVSATASVTVVGVTMPDIEGDIADAINEALGTSSAAQEAAVDAMQAALTAQEAADDANTEALVAAGIANGKGKVIYQASAPTGANASTNNLWIRTTDNKPHTYNGSAWVAVESKVATDAATAAATADAKAVAAQATANSAASAAAAAQDTATTALTSASGRNAIYHSTAAASGSGTRVGDMWHQWSSQGVNGRLLAVWVWTGSAWQQRLLDETYIPLVNIGAGTYGSLSGVRLEADSISVRKLLVTNLTNLADDPSFEGGANSPWSMNAMCSIVTNNPRTGSNHLRITATGVGYPAAYTTPIQVEAGEVYRFTIHQRIQSGAATTGDVLASIRYGTSPAVETGVTTTGPGGITATSTYQAQFCQFVVPAGVTYIRAEIRVLPNAVGKTYDIDDVSLTRMTDGSLIVDGGVTSRTLATDEIWANQAWLDKATISVLHVGALDGFLITGATMRTAASGQRLQLDTTGLRAYNSSNTVTGQLSAASGGLTLSGTFRSGSGNQRLEITSTEMGFYDSAAFFTGSISAVNPSPGSSYGGVRIQGLGGSLTVAKTDLPGGGTAGVEVTGGLFVSSTLSVGGNAEIGDTGSIVTVPGHIDSPNIPWAMAAGRIASTLTIDPGSGRTQTVTFPSGRFSVAPIVTATVRASARLNVAVLTGETSSGFSTRIDNWSGAAGVPDGINWTAVQMGSGTASG